MSQKKEKYARSIEARVSEVEQRMDDVCRRQIISDHYTAALKQVHDWSEETLLTERKKHRREIREARREASRWKANAVLALVLLGLVFACCIVYTSAQEPEAPQDGPAAQYLPDDGRLPGDDVPAAERCYMAPEDIEAAENERIEAALLARAARIENVKVTHYCVCETCCGKTPEDPAYGITASGLRATPGVSVGVDPDVIPLGADVLVDYGDGELHYYRADDTGSGVTGAHIDLCVGSHEEALQAGVRTATVWWVMP